MSGFYKADYYLVSPTTQYNLSTMGRMTSEQCILISDIKADSVPFEMK